MTFDRTVESIRDITNEHKRRPGQDRRGSTSKERGENLERRRSGGAGENRTSS